MNNGRPDGKGRAARPADRERRVHHVCGEEEDREKPSGAHYQWHLRHGDEPCPKSRMEEKWWHAERRAGKPLPDWEPFRGHVCGEEDDREKASDAHYAWHRINGQEACPKSKAEASWRRAEHRAGRPLPDWTPQTPVRYVCGGAEDRIKASIGHYRHHRNRGEEQCEKALAEYAWYMAEHRAGKPLPEWTPFVLQSRECGEYRDREKPGTGHYQWHIYKGEKPCGKSRAENSWRKAERKAGKPLPRWMPRR